MMTVAMGSARWDSLKKEYRVIFACTCSNCSVITGKWPGTYIKCTECGQLYRTGPAVRRFELTPVKLVPTSHNITEF